MNILSSCPLPIIAFDSTTGYDVLGFGNKVDSDGVTWYGLLNIAPIVSPARYKLLISGPDDHEDLECNYLPGESRRDVVVFSLVGTVHDSLYVYRDANIGMRLAGHQHVTRISNVDHVTCAAEFTDKGMTIVSLPRPVSVPILTDLADAIESYVSSGGTSSAGSMLDLFSRPDAVLSEPGDDVRDVPLWCIEQLRGKLLHIRSMLGQPGMTLRMAVMSVATDLLNLAHHLRTYLTQPVG